MKNGKHEESLEGDVKVRDKEAGERVRRTGNFNVRINCRKKTKERMWKKNWKEKTER